MPETIPLEPEADLWLAVEQFNSQQFYACHDTLEAMWMEAVEPDKTFYQGILQVAVALYHLGNQNLRGAMILLGEGTNRLRRYEPDYAEIDVTSLVACSTTLLTVLQHTEPEQVGTIALQVLQPTSGDRSISELLPKITQTSRG